jgi:hypothetical protein
MIREGYAVMPVRDLLFTRKGKAGDSGSRMSAPFGKLLA